MFTEWNSSKPNRSELKWRAFRAAALLLTVIVAHAGPPGYEPAFVNGTTVWINAIEVKQNPTQHAQADFYEVVHPFNPLTGQPLSGYPTPQCNPCDHPGDGITPDDYHDHILDSQPGNPGHGEYSPLWHVFVVLPNYTSSAAHNTAVNNAYKTALPITSEAAVDALLALKDANGVPLAIEIDTHFYFICAVVNQNAAH